MSEKWSFEQLFRTWNSLVTRHRRRSYESTEAARAAFGPERDELLLRAGWTKLEFYTACDEYHRSRYA